MNDLEFLKDYDWRAAFHYADFDIEDVKEVYGYDDGENDGENWIIYGQLNDERYFFLSAGCDFTGWDCQASGLSNTSDSIEELVRTGMGDYDRERLDIIL